MEEGGPINCEFTVEGKKDDFRGAAKLLTLRRHLQGHIPPDGLCSDSEKLQKQQQKQQQRRAKRRDAMSRSNSSSSPSPASAAQNAVLSLPPGARRRQRGACRRLRSKPRRTRRRPSCPLHGSCCWRRRQSRGGGPAATDDSNSNKATTNLDDKNRKPQHGRFACQVNSHEDFPLHVLIGSLANSLLGSAFLRSFGMITYLLQSST